MMCMDVDVDMHSLVPPCFGDVRFWVVLLFDTELMHPSEGESCELPLPRESPLLSKLKEGKVIESIFL